MKPGSRPQRQMEEVYMFRQYHDVHGNHRETNPKSGNLDQQNGQEDQKN